MKFNVSKLQPYAKTVVAVAGIAVLIGKAIADGTVSVDELQEIGVAVLVAVGVYQVPNKPAKK